jgi:HK97 family phage portal protein
MIASALLWGGGFAEIVRDGAGRVVELWQIAPDRVTIDRVNRDGRLVYVIDNHSASNTVLEKDQVFHLHGLGFDGISGYSVVRLAARSIGIGMAAEKFGASFYANGTWVGGVLQTDAQLSINARTNIKESWAEMHRGPDRAFHPAILEEGLKYQPLGMPMTDAEFLATRKFQVTDIARWFRVPPHKLADLERATFSNIEHQSLEFVQDTVLPWAIRLEQEANVKLFGLNRQNFFTKLNLNALLRGDAASRFRAYSIGRQWGWLSANDIRELEDMNPIGEQGDIYLIPLNMVDAKSLTKAGKEEVQRQEMQKQQLLITEEKDQEEVTTAAVLRSAHRDLIATALTRVAKREQKWADNARRKFDGAELATTIMGFLTSDGHKSYVNDVVMPPLMAFARIVFAGQITADVERVLVETVELITGERLVETQERLLVGDDTLDFQAEADHLIDRVIQLRMTIPAAA